MLSHKLSALHAQLSGLDSALVAFSGGVDSSVLALLTHDILGDRMQAVNICSPCFDTHDREHAEALARETGFRLHTITMDPLKDSAIRANPPDRCYLCKKMLFHAVLELAGREGIGHVLEGSNIDDRNDYRPGLQAVRELSVLSPLLENDLTKEDIRRIARDRKLAVADRPAQACFMTRFPFGNLITYDRIDHVRKAEELLKILGFDVCRVRAHNDLARIEVPRDRCAEILGRHYEQIVAEFHQLGFHHITLDLEGYIPGSLNRAVPSQKKG